MNNVNEYKDIVAYHPGYYIAVRLNLLQEWEQQQKP